MAPASPGRRRAPSLAGALAVAATSGRLSLAAAHEVLPTGPLLRRLAATLRGAGDSEPPARALEPKCRSVSLRLMPPPALTKYSECFQGKLAVNSTHDWSVPGAQLDAQAQCWCKHNLKATMQEYNCCNHHDLGPMCLLDCQPDCKSDLAETCLSECPSMCFEASEYVVDKDLCAQCDWDKCFPVLKCLTQHAKQQVTNGAVEPTCHENRFKAGEALKQYGACWRDAPKHSSHWNVLSSVVHCICREGMVAHLNDTSCCDSMLYGGGACDVHCPTEQTCMSQEAQTCVHSCGARCAAFDLSPDQDCVKHCLHSEAPCRKFLGCRPPMLAGHVCDDGRWPDASSGCCKTNRTYGVLLGCPRLCDVERVWRLDGGRAIPWWSRRLPDHGVVAQCSCDGCPTSSHEAVVKLTDTVGEDLWDNGQTMLIDVARREGLLHGPNRRMQELMVARNDEIMKALEASSGDHTVIVASINDQYAELVTSAARVFGDDAEAMPEQDSAQSREKTGFLVFVVVASISTCAIITAIGLATRLVLQRRRPALITEFQPNAEVVIGSPVIEEGDSGAVTGAPVTVAAPTKPTKGTFVSPKS